MPVFKLNTEDLVLPSTKDLAAEEQAIVTVKKKLTLKDIVAVNTGDTEMDRTINGVLVYVTKWNYTDEAGVDLPITRENLVELDKDDYNFIVKKYNEALTESYGSVGDEEKKASTDTLTPPTIPIEVQQG